MALHRGAAGVFVGLSRAWPTSCNQRTFAKVKTLALVAGLLGATGEVSREEFERIRFSGESNPAGPAGLIGLLAIWSVAKVEYITRAVDIASPRAGLP